MAARVAAIHVFGAVGKVVDGRHTGGHDEMPQPGVPFKARLSGHTYSAGAGLACRRMNPNSNNGGTIVSIISR